MPMTEQQFLTQMAAMNRACMDMCKQFILANPDSDLEDWAEDCFEECAGDAALCDLWLEVSPGDEGAENSASSSIRKSALDWHRKQKGV